MPEKFLVMENNLLSHFKRWELIFREGCHDPFYADGTNLNLVRNHILAEKGRMERAGYFPEVYFRETPCKVDNHFMAQPDKIRQNALEALEEYQNDTNYQYLSRIAALVPAKLAEEVSLYAVLGYVIGLERALQADDLISMRRHTNPKRYLESFQRCRTRLAAFF